MLFLITTLYHLYSEKKKADAAIKKFKRFVAKKNEQIRREDAGESVDSVITLDSLDDEDLGYIEREYKQFKKWINFLIKTSKEFILKQQPTDKKLVFL
jgi:hypothetical protein